MERKLRKIRLRIENLRNEMVLTFVQNGADMSNPQVLRLSQLLDEQLNRYERCEGHQSLGKAVNVGQLPLFSYRHPQVAN